MLRLVAPARLRITDRHPDARFARLDDHEVGNPACDERPDVPLQESLEEHPLTLRPAPELLDRRLDVLLTEVDHLEPVPLELLGDALLVPRALLTQERRQWLPVTRYSLKSSRVSFAWRRYQR